MKITITLTDYRDVELFERLRDNPDFDWDVTLGDADAALGTIDVEGPGRQIFEFTEWLHENFSLEFSYVEIIEEDGGEKMADDKPQPGDPNWTHPHVKGMTDPKAIKALSDAIDAYDRQERERVATERVNRKW